MEKILKMLFEPMFYENSSVEKIETVTDLCNAVWDSIKVARIFAAMNDMNDEYYDTAKILAIANEAYQEVCGNE